MVAAPTEASTEFSEGSSFTSALVGALLPPPPPAPLSAPLVAPPVTPLSAPLVSSLAPPSAPCIPLAVEGWLSVSCLRRSDLVQELFRAAPPGLAFLAPALPVLLFAGLLALALLGGVPPAFLAVAMDGSALPVLALLGALAVASWPGPERINFLFSTAPSGP